MLPKSQTVRKYNSITGFTLVELLIASLIFALVMLTVYSAFNVGIFSSRNISETINIYQSARLILERINLDIRNSFNYSNEDTMFSGNKSDITFLALIDTFKEDKNVQEYSFVSYKLEGNKLMRLCRKNQEALNRESEVKPQEMSSDIEGIVFNYGYIDANNQLQWKEIWNDLKVLPVAVKIKLTLKDKIRQEFERTIYLPSAI